MKTNDSLLNQSIPKLLFSLAIPAIAAQLVNVLYNIVDRMYIGRIPEVGTQALTGLGVAFPILMLISAFAALVGMGGAPLASIALGEQKKEKAEKILGNAVMSLLVLSVVLTIGFTIYLEPILMLFGASEATLPYAASYLQIYLVGTVFVMLGLGLNNFLNAQGFAKFGMLTVIIGAITNIVLDPILIFGFNMGVQGAALATVIAQGVSAVWVVWFLLSKRTTIRIKAKYFKPDFKILGTMFALGIAPFIMQSTESIVMIVFNTQLLRLGGDLYVGTMVVLSSISQIVLLPMMGLCQGAQPIIGYNFGAQQYDRVKETIRTALIAALSISVCMWAINVFAPRVFAVMFTGDEALLELTTTVMKVYFFGIFAFGAQIVLQNAFIALGEAKISLFLAMLRKIIILIPLVYLLPNLGFGVMGIYLAQPIADIIATTTTTIVFARRSKVLLQTPVPQEVQ
ncbi:MAG: MATE family efflux transporter [Erysipelotrichaceae bacterium]